MSLKRTFLAGLMALCLGVSSLAAADGIYVKRDSMGRKIGQLLYIDEVFNKKSKIVMTYLVAKDLSEAYRVKPNGEALQIYARGGVG